MTKIEWTDETWNPVTGCTKISPGCANCYAERMAKRLAENRTVFASFKYADFQVATWEDRLSQPLRWTKPRRVFVCSMGDLFHDNVPEEFIEKVWWTMARAQRHTFQVLTKRAERMQNHLSRQWEDAAYNVWLGVTAEDQKRANERIPLLLQTPAAVRFVSVEPMLGPVNLNEHLGFCLDCDAYITEHRRHGDLYHDDVSRLDWVIIGCESGPNRRPMKLEWAVDLVRQCKNAGVAVFVKQLDIGGKVSKNPDEWPAELRAREYPR